MSKYTLLLTIIFICFALFLAPIEADAGVTVKFHKTITLDVEKSLERATRPYINTPLSKLQHNRSSLLGNNYNKWRDGIILGVSNNGVASQRYTPSGGPGFEHSAGLPFVSLTMFNWAQYDMSNQIIGFKGINWLLGFESKTYLKPPLRVGEWNTFWHWGTAFVILPYVGIGTEYTSSSVYFEIGTFYIFPYIALGMHF